MRAIWLIAIVAFGALRSASAQLDAPTALSDFGGCSHETCTWVPTFNQKTFTRAQYQYTVNGGTFQLTSDGKLLFETSLLDLSASVSVVWSKDNSSFAITWSNGGAIGGFQVRSFKIDGDRVTEEPVTKSAWPDFKARHYCKPRGDNIQAYEWSSAGDKLLLVLSVYPTGDCGKDLGHTEAYWVQANTGEIRQHLTLRELNLYMKHHPQM